MIYLEPIHAFLPGRCQCRASRNRTGRERFNFRGRRKMKDMDQLSPEVIYQLVADVGFRRYFHFGGLVATTEVIDLCHIDKDSYVLDVGCASGKTACYVARQYGCRVVGVDILERMIERSKERAKREGVEDKVRFEVADAQDLPFEDDLFDVVMGEFIAGLLDDKQRAVHEFTRLTKPGGHVGVNEATWIKTSPPDELAEYLRGTFGVKGRLLTSLEWRDLLAGAGLSDIVVRTHEVHALSAGHEGLGDAVRVGHRVVYMYVRSSAFRRFLRETLSLPRNLFEYFGYGIYVGRK